MNHYRDHGYGMSHRVGYIAGLRGEAKEVQPVGATFPSDEKNTLLWKRWFRYLVIDMWVVFAIGAFLGMLLPTILMSHSVALSGEVPTDETVTTFVAVVLRDEYGGGLFFLALLVGTLILFSTQLGIFEAMVRNFTDGANAISPRFRKMVAGDPRRFYFPFMLLLIIVIAILIRATLPVRLIQISANMSNFGALIWPFVLMYLNSKLPPAARPNGCSHRTRDQMDQDGRETKLAHKPNGTCPPRGVGPARSPHRRPRRIRHPGPGRRIALTPSP